MKKLKDILSEDELTQLASSVCDVFEDVLEENNVTIPDDEREGYGDDEVQARLFGTTYYEVEDKVKEIVGDIEVDDKEDEIE